MAKIRRGIWDRLLELGRRILKDLDDLVEPMTRRRKPAPVPVPVPVRERREPDDQR